MNSSESIKEIATALCKAQSQMGAAKKDSTNPHFNSKYADLASIVDAIRGPLFDNGLAWTQLPHPSEKPEIIVETVLMHTSGEWISNVVAFPVSKQDAQGYKSAMTYARRAGVECITGIPADDDDGNAASKAKPRASEEEMMPRAKGTHAPPGPLASSVVATISPAMVEGADGGAILEMDATAPRARPEGRTTFEYKKGQYTTAGMTKEQFVASLDLAKRVAVKYRDPNKAHALLIKEFGVTSRSELTGETGAQYLVRLQELADSE